MWKLRMIFRGKYALITILLFLFFSVWWLTLPATTGSKVPLTTLWWGASYQVIAWFGALYGIFISNHWGGFKSLLGRAILFFSLGLFLQAIGQTVSTYFVLRDLGVPYPSLSDVGFFGSIIFYAYGAILLAKASGANISLRSLKDIVNKPMVVLIPLVMLSFSAFIFLKGYRFNWSQPLATLLDVGYPLGQAFYVSAAILTFFLSRKTLGGIMKMPILFLIIALFAQYVSDFSFLYHSYSDSYVAGGFVDYLYLLSYFLMALGLIQLGAVLNWIKET